MTTLAAVQGSGWVVFGVDSRVVEDRGRTFTLPANQSKLVRKGPYIMSAAGDLRAVNLLEHVFEPPDPADRTGRKLDRFISAAFLPELKDCLEQAGYAKDNQLGSVIFICVNGVGYELGEDYSYMRDASGMYACGSGGDYAIGALHALIEDSIETRDVDTAKYAVKHALNIATKLDNGTAPPHNVVVQYSN
jgi:ATP-dependent protease HslVU (ClpYQ) peptidase subunit